MTDKLIKESKIDCLETIDSKLVPYGDCYGRGCINCKDIHSLIKKEQEGEDLWDTDLVFLSDNLDKLNKR